MSAATEDLQAAESRLATTEAAAAHTAGQLDELRPLAGLSRRGREQRRMLRDKLAADTEGAVEAKGNCDEFGRRISRLRRDQAVFDRFETAEGWRRQDIVTPPGPA